MAMFNWFDKFMNGVVDDTIKLSNGPDNSLTCVPSVWTAITITAQSVPGGSRLGPSLTHLHI